MQHTQYISLDQVNFSNHFSERLQERFKITIDQIKSQLSYFKLANTQCKFKTVVTKVAKDPSNKYFYHEKLNLVISVDPRSKTAITAMFIDNPDWNVRVY
jgi:hypothetical protein